MRNLGTLLVILLLAQTSLAQFKGGAYKTSKGSEGRFMLGGFFGQATFNPADINTNAKQQGTNPPFNSLTSYSLYGARLDYRVFDKWGLGVRYEAMEAKNLTATISPGGGGTDNGTTLRQEVFTAAIYYHMHRNIAGGSGNFSYIGLGGVYPHNAEVMTRKQTTNLVYEVDRNYGYVGYLGFGFLIAPFASIILEASYLYHESGLIHRHNKTTYLMHQTGNGIFQKSRVQWHGGRAAVHLAFMF